MFRRNDKPRTYPTFSTWPTGSYHVDVVGESFHYDTIRSIIAKQSNAATGEVYAQAQLIPEPNNPADPHAILVTVDWQEVGYLARDDAAPYGDILRPIFADTGQVLTAPAQLWWGTARDDGSDIVSVRLDLPPEHMFFPVNSPPPAPAFMLPKSTQYKVIDLDESIINPLFSDDRDEVAMYVTLTPVPDELQPRLELRYEGVRIGHLSKTGDEALMSYAIWLENSTVNLYCLATARRGDPQPVVKVRVTPDVVLMDKDSDEWGSLIQLFDANPRRDAPQSQSTPQPTEGDLPPAQWYTDPYDATQLRYWDGERWTEHIHRP